MRETLGLGKLSRERLSEVLRQAKGSITPKETAEILNLPLPKVSRILAYWAEQGWLSRVRRGLYLSVPLEASNPDLPIDSPWDIAAKIFSPCYIGGWNAAEYWGLTEQIFRTVIVMTVKRPHDRNLTIKNINFLLQTISSDKLFGLKSVWQDKIKVNISDPTRTIVDLLNDPELGGGIRSVLDLLQNYFKSEYKNVDLLIRYSDKFGNGAVFKRLGYLIEQYFPDEKQLLENCRARLTKGNAKLDINLPSNFLITRWNLWVSKNYKKGS